MNIRTIVIYIGNLLLWESVAMVPALGIAWYNNEKAAANAIAATIFLLVLVGLPLMRLKRQKTGFQAREGFITVALGWILISLFGALPFFLSKAIPNYIDAFFETVSGFTTTGASILQEIESMPRGLLYWRSFTHWVGGMGVLVLVLAFSSLAKGGGALHLMRAESPGPSVGKLTPTLRQTARILYSIYVVLTLVQIVLLLLGGMSLFDSACHTFGTAGTGGFSVKNLSVGAYQSTYIEIVIGVFMLLFGMNFAMFYLLLLRQFGAVWKNQELRLYLALAVFFTIIIAFNIWPQYGSFSQALLKSFFQVSSIITTTGFATADFNAWPQLARYSIVLLTFLGACAGSTAGGLKSSRVLILWQSLKSHMHIMLRPRAIRPVRVEGHTLEEEVVRGVHSFLAAYMFIALISMLLLSMDNFSLETTLTSVVTALGNTGPGLDMVGPRGNFFAFSPLSKLVLCADMLLGRLEIFPLLLLFSPATWRRQA